MPRPAMVGAPAGAGFAIAVAVAFAGGCGRFDFDPHAPATSDAGNVSDATLADGSGPDGPFSSPIAFVQAAGASGGGVTTKSAGYSADVVAGDLLVVAIDYDTAPSAVTTVDDTVGNSFTLSTQSTGGPYNVRLLYAISKASGPDLVTVTIDHTTNFFDIQLFEYTGISAIAPFDVASTAFGNSTAIDGVAASPLVTTGFDELLFGFAAFNSNGVAGTGFTMRAMFDGDPSEDRIVDAPGTYPVTESWQSGLVGWSLVTAAFHAQ